MRYAELDKFQGDKVQKRENLSHLARNDSYNNIMIICCLTMYSSIYTTWLHWLNIWNMER